MGWDSDYESDHRIYNDDDDRRIYNSSDFEDYEEEESDDEEEESDVDDDAGRGDGLVVSVFAFNSNDQSLNQTKVRNFYCVNFCLKSKKRGLEWPLPKMTWYLRLICW